MEEVMRRFAVVLLPLLIAACRAPSSVTPMTVPLQYKAMLTPGEVPAVPQCAALSKIEVQDTRDEKNIGKRYVEGKPSAIAAVTTSDDVAAWAARGFENTFKRAGVTVGKEGAPVLRIRIVQIVTNENVVHRSGYDGRIVMSVELGAGGSCWKESAEGSSENYGYAGSVENYQETLNHALDRAAARVLSSPDFRKAVCSCNE
jgi:uncharacterized lipoprotein YajG